MDPWIVLGTPTTAITSQFLEQFGNEHSIARRLITAVLLRFVVRRLMRRGFMRTTEVLDIDYSAENTRSHEYRLRHLVPHHSHDA